MQLQARCNPALVGVHRAPLHADGNHLRFVLGDIDVGAGDAAAAAAFVDHAVAQQRVQRAYFYFATAVGVGLVFIDRECATRGPITK